jgi:D-arabinan exo alpha-(1,3)/(1,5)-arabinofuranosidase (non-reducing end)
MMNRIAKWVFCCLLVSLLMPLAGANALENIARAQAGKTMRWSTGIYDPESNADSYHIKAGEKLTFCELDGPGEIRHIWFTVGSRDRRYPRNLVVRVYYDDSTIASVESPIGDFFAAGNGMRAPVSTLPIEVTSYGRSYNSYWRMPFKKKFRLELENQSTEKMGVYCQVNWAQFDEFPKDAHYFHAQYYQEAAPPPRFKTYTLFNCKGEGHFVGVVLSSQNTVASWFGEADDRYFIDGELEPRLVGTGLEDYFTDAWNLRTFTNLNAGVPICEPRGEDTRITMYRWHINEPVIYKKSLRIEVERRSYTAVVNPKTGKRTVWDFKYRPDFWSSVAFWYHKGIAPRWTELAPVEKRTNPEIVVETSRMALEEDKGGIRTSPGLELTEQYNRTCHGKRETFMANTKTGAWIEIPCKVDKYGRYSISVFQALKKDRGIWKCTLTGPDFSKVVDERMDCYDPYLALRYNYPENVKNGTWFENKVGIYNLKAGDYIFRFDCIGNNPLSWDDKTGAPGYNFALDGISLRKLPVDDPWAWMQDYLKEEEKYFAELVAQAKEDLKMLTIAIEAYRIDYRKPPHSLKELMHPVKYIKILKRDPWNQEYQYKYPGEINADGYDLYSWHGHSRDRRKWIGNWKGSLKRR